MEKNKIKIDLFPDDLMRLTRATTLDLKQMRRTEYCMQIEKKTILLLVCNLSLTRTANI